MTETEVRGKRENGKKMSIRQMIDIFKIYVIIIVISTRQGKVTGAEIIFKKIMAENFPKW